MFFIGSLFLVAVNFRLRLACEEIISVPPDGFIQSPNYPLRADNNTNCMWRLKPSLPHTTIIITIQDLDIEPDGGDRCAGTECCRHNWLSVPVSGAGRLKTRQLCGRRPAAAAKPIVVRSADVPIKFHISRVDRGGRGFRLNYRAFTAGGESAGCHNWTECPGASDGGVPGCIHGCTSGVGCYSEEQKCDGRPDCADWSDETDCHVCEKGKALCPTHPLLSRQFCIRPSTQRCDGIFDCPLGQDETNCVPGCEGRIACLRGVGCYAPWQRCDSRADCGDESDEAACPGELCAAGRRPCRNGRCLSAALWCDSVDDCGDGTDEDGCLRNSLVVTVLLGCLLCGMLLVAAVACAFRAYGHRYSHVSSRQLMRIPPHITSRLRMSTSSSLPALLEDDFFLREPPPAYSEAVGEAPPLPPYRSSHPRNSRRHRPRPVPPPQVMLKPPEPPPPFEASSSQSSSSRGSLSSVSLLSGTDDTLLLSS